MTTDEDFGNDLLSNLITRAQTLQRGLDRLPADTPYPSPARSALLQFLSTFNRAIIQRLAELKQGPPPPGYTSIETAAKRLGLVLTLLFKLLEFAVHSEAHRVPSPLIAPFEAMARRFFTDALLLVRYLWEYNFNYENLGRLRDFSTYSGLTLRTLPPEHFIVLGFPVMERENVLLHCAFAHELGHFLTQAGHLDNGIPITIDPVLYKAVPQQSSTQLVDTALRWYRELCADMFATYLIGPAYFLAFAEIGMQALHTAGASHPPPHLRLSFMLTVLRRMSYLDEKDGTGAVTRLGLIGADLKAHYEKWSAFLAANPLGALDPFYTCLLDAVRKVLDRIEWEVKAVVGAEGYTADRFAAEVGPLTERILRLIPPVEADGVPQPSFVSILNAGWVVKTTRLSDLRNIVSAESPEQQLAVNNILNGLIYKAIEYLIIKDVWTRL